MDFNDLYYTASLIEYVGRKTKNRRSEIAHAIGIEGIDLLLDVADINHCLPMEQVADELIEDYEIAEGSFDTVSQCRFSVPSEMRIGKVYARLAEQLSKNESQYAEKLFEVFVSPFSDAVSDFNSALYFAPSDEIFYYYETEYSSAS